MLIKLLYIFTLGLSLLAASAPQAGSQDAETARQVVEAFHSQLLATMKAGRQLGYAGRYEKLSAAVAKSHDLEKIARVIVGREWERLTTAQQHTLVAAFSRLSIAAYAHNFREHAGESFVFDSIQETGKGGVVVHSRLKIPNERDVELDYMLKDNGDTWQIINVIANGVSDLALKRTEYTTILQRDGFDALIAKINERIDSYSKL